MKEIVLIIHEDVTLSTVTGAMDMLIHTNNLFKQNKKPLPFNITMAGGLNENKVLPLSSPLVKYHAIGEIKQASLIIVPAFYGDRDERLKKHQNIIKWVKHMHSNGTEVASMCSGCY